MVDRQYSDPALAAVYGVFNPREPCGDFDFYLPLAAVRSVLTGGGRFVGAERLGELLAGAGGRAAVR